MRVIVATDHTQRDTNTHTHTHTCTRQDTSGRVIGQSQRPLPDNTQHLKETDTHTFGEIRTGNPSQQEAADPRIKPPGHRNSRTPASFYEGAVLKANESIKFDTERTTIQIFINNSNQPFL